MTDLDKWQGCRAPALASAQGRFARVERAEFPRDAAALFAAIGGEDNDDLWRYIPLGPFVDAETMGATLGFVAESQGWMIYLLRDRKTDEVLGTASYMRLRPEAGSAEVGCVVYSKRLQRTPIATEAMYLMARHLFVDLGYRRYEWKCDDGNAASKRAARRLGFTFEGVFRQDLVVKGRNRNTAWFSMLDGEWPRLERAFDEWLAPENFDKDARQRRSLEDLRATRT